jgi:hypothetical protein
MSLAAFIEQIKQNDPVNFDQTMAIITEYYHYQATEFYNGIKGHLLTNLSGTNEGSCKIFAFANIHNLDPEQTLNLFGDYYRIDVLNNPNGTDHQNIRCFIQYGWNGIRFDGVALVAK